MAPRGSFSICPDCKSPTPWRSAVSKKYELFTLPESLEDRGRGVKQDAISRPAVDLLVAYGFARAPSGIAGTGLDGDQTPAVLQLRKKRLEIGLNRAIDE